VVAWICKLTGQKMGGRRPRKLWEEYFETNKTIKLLILSRQEEKEDQHQRS
jgi:hypothetical protein